MQGQSSIADCSLNMHLMDTHAQNQGDALALMQIHRDGRKCTESQVLSHPTPCERADWRWPALAQLSYMAGMRSLPPVEYHAGQARSWVRRTYWAIDRYGRRRESECLRI